MSATPFAARLAAVMVAVVLAASALTVSLNYLKFRRVLRMQEDLVYLFVAHDLAGVIEDGMNLGLPLAAMQATDPLIRRRRAAERGTLGISVFDSTGTILFDTDRFRVGTKLPQDWSGPGGGATEWRGDLVGAYLVGGSIINNFGQAAGGVVLRYDPAALESRMNAILLDMTRAGLLTLLGCAVAAVAAGMLLTRRYRTWFGRATAQVDAPGEAGRAAEGSEGVVAALREAGLALEAAEAELMRLGTLEPAAERAAARAGERAHAG